MLHRAQTSLQIKLILAFTVVMLIPTAAFSAYHLLRDREALRSRISAEQLSLADARSAAAVGRISAGGAGLFAVRQAPALRQYARDEPGAAEAVTATLKAFLDQSSGRYSGLCLLSPVGRELLCVRDYAGTFQRTPAADLVSRAEDPAFQAAMRQGGRPDGQPFTIVAAADSAAGLLHYAITYPDQQGHPAGALRLEAPLAPLLAVLIDPNPAVSTMVVAADGTYLLASNQQPRTALSRAKLADVQPADAQIILQQASGTLVNTADRPGLFQVFTRLQPPVQGATPWTVIYAQPSAALLDERWSTWLVILLAAGAAFVVALALSHYLARELLAPLRALASAAERVADDDLGVAIPAGSLTEVAALGRSLDRTIARLREARDLAEGRRNEAETLRAATQALGATLDRDMVLELILSELRKVVPYDSASVQAIVRDEAVIIGTYGLVLAKEMIGVGFSLLDKTCPNAEVARTRAPVILDDGPLRYPIFKAKPYEIDPIRSWLGVPMIFGECLIGMITLDKHQPGFYTAEHARLAAAFATQAAAAMENARLYAVARRDLADRHRAEAAHARLAAIIEATTDLVGMSDMEGRILFLNQAGRRTLGIPDDEDLSNEHAAKLYPERLLAWLRSEAIPTAISTGAWSGETIALTRDGNEIPVSQVIIAHKAADGSPESLSTIVRDMRERLRAEEELRQAQKIEALGRLAGGMAHDFNNLLTVILGEADMLLDDTPPGSPTASSVEQIRQAGARASTLTRQLLAFSRRQVLQPELINLGEVVAGMEQMLRRLLGEDILLTISLAPGLPLVRADPGQLEQVVMNLCLNGRDAMPTGGKLSIETAPARLDESAARLHPGVTPGPYTMLVVTDSGEGMDEQTQAHIFEPFFTTKARGKGTGLGLATVHGIIRQSGGHIWFASEPKRGSCFQVYLPAAQGESVATEAVPALPAAQAAAETVLLVEDDEHVRSLARQILTRLGYNVLEAGDGQSAISLVAAHAERIHVLLTDVIMPGGMNGVQLAKALREQRPAIRIVYMSGYTDNALVGQSLHADGAAYLQKPFTPAELAAIVAEQLRPRA